MLSILTLKSVPNHKETKLQLSCSLKISLKVDTPQVQCRAANETFDIISNMIEL